jgi:chemotaxis protein MotA
MLLIIGALVVLGSIVGGYLMEGGHLLLLNQPAEFIIIGGAALGSLLISTPMPVLKQLVAQSLGVLGSGLNSDDYKDLLALQYQLFRVIQQTGVMALESHFENPDESAIMRTHPKFLKRHHSVAFLADSVKVIIVGGMSPHDLDSLMEEDLQVHHDEASQPAATMSRIGDSLPGLGIVAAVLGIVLTMQSLDGPAAEIGEKVGAALVGTFLGILMAYGFALPLATSLEQRVKDDSRYDQCIKAGVLAIFKGFPPAIAVEFARRTLPQDVRPTFEETEALCRASRTDLAAVGVAA